MSEACYEVYAVRYGHHVRRAADNFVGGDPHDIDMPLDYFVWVIRNDARTIVVDTGFNEGSAAARGRQLLHPVAEGLRALGITPAAIDDVIITHLHYDHAGNLPLFERARYHLQAQEMSFATGPCMCHAMMRHGYDADDVVQMVRYVFDERVRFHAGTREIAPGIEVHHIGGHTKGLQSVRVRTRRGWVVLASDASHLYAHMEQGRAFTTLYNLADMLDGYETLRALASSPQHIVPGHDPIVMQRYPVASPGLEDWIVRLDTDPVN